MVAKSIKITIPDYPDKVLIAKSRRPILYVSSISKARGRTNIPKSYLNNPKYTFDANGVLTDVQSGLPKLANPQTAGKPRYWVVNFQDIWNQNLTKQDRAIKIDKLKNVIRPYIKKIKAVKKFPIGIEIILYDTECKVDISNRGAIYTKVIEDLLVSEGKIPDDSVEYITSSGKISFVKTDESEKRMEIIITRR